ncbi:MAG: Cell division protein DivIC (FtsB), stabilizes FtsL against RasP cleavage [uncultured Sphingomonas sp.]|uniref:Cell division protein DivIC (FtsB), stabilizes FtsL against RasP cleavage n=1 Tax=uncultured Sphingomonas sp. TaxID=158754 RepID=A0A6J4TFS1_9SPHN|nr:DUF58 domain-containing protein [uncultured Sphingomonas sp.]CAA9520949.1 MAG: Cell division protein DivIC (FtsB), stabilizes FtsL against RasP cleavage [uncultured Sphingomonas sp.]
MIYPTRRAVLAAAAGAPVALTVAAVAPERWFLATAWPLLLLLLCLVDSLRSRGPALAEAKFPPSAYVGETREASVRIAIASAPAQAEVALDADPRVVVSGGSATFWLQLQDGRGRAGIPLEMVRRGTASFDRLTLRWTGPLGLLWQQAEVELGVRFPILPDLRPTSSHGIQLFERHAFEGLLAHLTSGEGSDFDTLVEYRTGMDRRTIDWKHSARDGKLVAKRYHGERNNQVVFAVDCGRQMSEPIAGLPRVDRVVAAMLLTGWLALKLGDRVAVHAFDSRPRLASGLVSGSGAFAELQRAAAAIDYSGEETNYTFALTTLAAGLTRRSMIILYTEFTDPVSASFLVLAMRRLVRTHLVLVVVLRDEELAAIAEREPRTADDVTRTVTAAALLKERRVVVTSLQHLGVHVVESEHDRVSERLAHAYLDLKRRDLL